ncbi:hypothetical protein C8R46DRAFT_1121169 [Mycena filopes]|nr:hypothetical protein C8R46DRAFT_1121169 [Mycena filopes]
MLESESASALPFSSSKYGHPLPLGPTALRIEPFAPDADSDLTNSNSNSSAGATESRVSGSGGGGRAGMSGKAAQARQEYLTNQLRAVQWQLRALEGATATSPSTVTSPSATTPSATSPSATSPSTTTSSANGGGGANGSGAESANGASGADLQQARQQNEALQERIRALEGQLNSQWALGLSDEEAPPGYLD